VPSKNPSQPAEVFENKAKIVIKIFRVVVALNFIVAQTGRVGFRVVISNRGGLHVHQ
jgi:hypothetical protein